MTDAALIGPVAAPELHVMSFNIRRRMRHVSRRSPDLWSHRAPALRSLLAAEQPAVLGAQEALPDQADFVAASLGPHYQWVGRGRNADGEGELCPIYFDTRRLELVEWSQYALSETPRTPGSRSWGNMIPRVVVSAIFTDLATGAAFRLLNTHLDHLGRRSRLHSADMLSELVAARRLPTLLTGDFNTSETTNPYRRLVEYGRLDDTWTAATRRLTAAWGTFPNYRPPEAGRKRIDWILASRDIDVRAAAINPATYGGIAPSDHVPVHAVVSVAP